MRQARPNANPNLGFTVQLHLFEPAHWKGFTAWREAGWGMDAFFERKDAVVAELQAQMAAAVEEDRRRWKRTGTGGGGRGQAAVVADDRARAELLQGLFRRM